MYCVMIYLVVLNCSITNVLCYDLPCDIKLFYNKQIML